MAEYFSFREKTFLKKSDRCFTSLPLKGREAIKINK